MKDVRWSLWIMFYTVLLCGCGNPGASSVKTNEKVFDLPTYFDTEIEQLAARAPEIEKTVFTGNESETKTVQIRDWSRELSAFAAIDINKPAYKGYVKKDSSEGFVRLYVDNPQLDVSEVIIRYDAQNVPIEIQITRHIQNFLYTTSEKLSYRKNTSYRIEKDQDVWVLGSNNYVIEGKFGNN
jgi:hypothetical protein